MDIEDDLSVFAVYAFIAAARFGDMLKI